MSAIDKKVASEELLSNKWDRVISNFVVKTGLGLSVGIVASALLFKKRTWPIAISTGWGFGVAYADAERIFHPHQVPGVEFKKQKPVVLVSAHMISLPPPSNVCGDTERSRSFTTTAIYRMSLQRLGQPYGTVYPSPAMVPSSDPSRRNSGHRLSIPNCKSSEALPITFSASFQQQIVTTTAAAAYPTPIPHSIRTLPPSQLPVRPAIVPSAPTIDLRSTPPTVDSTTLTMASLACRVESFPLKLRNGCNENTNAEIVLSLWMISNNKLIGRTLCLATYRIAQQTQPEQEMNNE
ncbi:hypothetical protein [Absidia glauca]|uniref:MICOS complex subunit MIC10 n=1 Tax=Absidia glauca TaxID=4829 RepID=A0A168M0Z8_ABSGL|nr:hypothetical protein [Absidia glauca]